MSFKVFAKAVNDKFNKLAKAGELFVVGGADTEDAPFNRQFEQVYLKAFPEGTNPVYKTNTEHDCSCCKQFLRNLGGVISIDGHKIDTIWNVKGLPHPYDVVAKAMDQFVRGLPIKQLFRMPELRYGAEQAQHMDDGAVKSWNHFWAIIPKQFYMKEPGSAVGTYNNSVQVLHRGLIELQPEALQSIAGLVQENNLYRGAEFLPMVTAFSNMQGSFLALPQSERDAFVWEKAADRAAGFRNTVIGTLAVDLSSGVDIEDAVRMFESKVAPTNYKRPKALITQALVKSAMETIKGLGLEDSLSRRHAQLKDININNVLWANAGAKSKMTGGLESLLMAEAKTEAKGKPSPISWADFRKQVLPTMSAMDVLFKNQHVPNLVSLTTANYPDTPSLFKWGNNFGWSYNGNVTDAIKEKVKAAGGNVTNAKLRFSLAWYNFDDLDLHVRTPDGSLINFVSRYGQGGELDVDMNAGRGSTREPVENVSFKCVAGGRYRVWVNQFSKRETDNVGFTLQVDSLGSTTNYSYAMPLKASDNITVGVFTVKNGQVVDVQIGAGVSSKAFTTTVWGIQTEKFVPVDTMLLSPNYWDDKAVGNLHVMFVINGCKNDQPARGIYNEFLTNDLEVHRRVFEVLGDKTKCPPTDEQLSGLGYSSTRSDVVTVRCTTTTGVRDYEISF